MEDTPAKLRGVVISKEVFLACTTHALTTEAEEVMGLLLGDVRGDPSEPVAYIWRAVPQIRTDRRKDRVETSPEQMAHVSALADALSCQTGVVTRVVGWYHSHPHITVLPSHVDVGTQALYQMLDASFVGLIFSVFNTDSSSKGQHIQVTAFQSRMQAGGGGGGGLQAMSSDDLEGLDDATKQAIRLAAEESADGPPGWTRREVPLRVDASLDDTGGGGAADLVEVQRMMLQEEEEVYRQRRAAPGASPAVAAAGSSAGGGGGAAAALQQLHAACAHQQALVEALDTSLAPALAAVHALTEQLEVQEQQLRAQLQELMKLQPTAQSGAVADIARVSLI